MRKSSIVAAAILPDGCRRRAAIVFWTLQRLLADPNAPTQASTNQLFVGTLSNTFGNYEGPVAMVICQWMQQCAGVNGRFVETQAIYTIDAGTFDIPFQNIFNGGGLIGLRAVESQVGKRPARTWASPRCWKR